MKIKFFLAFLFTGVFPLRCAYAIPLKVVVVDQTSAGFPDVLVIVKQLGDSKEVFRELSDKNGTISVRDLPSGPYQLIATCPYGLCETTVREFMIKNEPFAMKLTLAMLPSSGDVVRIGHIEHREVEVQDSAGEPVPLVPVLVRDETAQDEKWYRTGSNGMTVIDVPTGTEMTVIAVRQEILVSKSQKTHDKNERIILILQ
jgi:uncharacterized surface anchored protein